MPAGSNGLREPDQVVGRTGARIRSTGGPLKRATGIQAPWTSGEDDTKLANGRDAGRILGCATVQTRVSDNTGTHGAYRERGAVEAVSASSRRIADGRSSGRERRRQDHAPDASPGLSRHVGGLDENSRG